MTNKPMVFVFGSNQRGYHGAGAALTAVNEHGARMGSGYGHFGNSFAIPTKDKKLNTLPLDIIKDYVDGFIRYANQHPDINFKVTRIGTGLAGIKDSAIAPLFQKAPANCFYDTEWKRYLPDFKNFWGTY